ncbi:acyl carrier protein [Anaerosporobacter sp.]|uniref:acyl carrier protein n=1 Tax=Anaerosporobacter sp. TaxID=1872529 RepID=UPI00286EBD69|nr:acyl carrier protein [Anaerosporobacter sp.]
MREQVLEIVTGIRPDVDFSVDAKLVTDGVLDSFDIVTLISELNDVFEIEIGVKELVPENFDSITSMVVLIERLRDEEE